MAINEFLNNITYQEFSKRYCISEEKFKALKKRIANLANSKEEFKKWFPKEIAQLKKILNVGKTSIDEERIEPFQTGWFYYRSQSLSPKIMRNDIENEDVKHRLYLTMDSVSRSEMAKRIIEKCNERNLPYNFKVQ